MKKIKHNYSKKNKGAILPLVAMGILAIAGLAPFLTENTDVNSKLTQDYDEANKIIWAMESAAQDKLRNGNIDSVSRGLGDQTVYREVKGDVKFNYGVNTSNPTFQAIGEVIQYNTFLNKHFCVLANGTSSKTDDTVNLRSISCGYVKPGVTTINNTTYAWDKNGKLYEINTNNELVPVSNVGGKVWQVVAGKNNNPVVLTTKLDAVPLIYNSSTNSYTQGNKTNNLYQLANVGIDDSVGITIDNKLIDINGNNIFSSEKVEDLALGSNHGLFLVAKDPNNAAKGYELYGWGNNESKQINCQSDTSEFNSPTAVECSLKAPTGVYSGSISPMNDFASIDDYFGGTYNYISTGKYDTSHFTYSVQNPYHAGASAQHIGPDYDKCCCPLCLDVWDLHTKNFTYNTSLTIKEDLPVTNLQILLDTQGLDSYRSAGKEKETVTTITTREEKYKVYYKTGKTKTFNKKSYDSNEITKSGNKYYYYDPIKNEYIRIYDGGTYPIFDYREETRTIEEEETEEISYNRTKCTFIKLDENGNETNEGFSFIGRDNLDLNENHKIVAPLGNQYLLSFDDNLQKVYDVTGNNVISNTGYTIPAGTSYHIKWEYYDTGLHTTTTSSWWGGQSHTTTTQVRPAGYYEFDANALFYGINPKALSEEQLIAQKSKSGSGYSYGGAGWWDPDPSILFGAIFRLNNDMFNLRGGMEYDDEVPTYYALAAGDNFSLAIIVRNTDMPTDGSMPTDFRIIGWGDDTYGQLGIGVASGAQKMTILPITTDIVSNYRDLQAGKYHALFLTKDGKVYSWGGSSTKASPHPVEALNSLGGGKFIVAVSAGNDCSSAVDNEGNIYTWTVSNETPAVIAGGPAFGQ